MSTLTLRRQGNSVGVTFVSDIRIRMGFEVGQELAVVELADGVKLVKRNLELERQIQGSPHDLSKTARQGPFVTRLPLGCILNESCEREIA